MSDKRMSESQVGARRKVLSPLAIGMWPGPSAPRPPRSVGPAKGVRPIISARLAECPGYVTLFRCYGCSTACRPRSFRAAGVIYNTDDEYVIS